MTFSPRMARLVMLLQEDPGLSLDELAARLAVSDKVVLIDLERAASWRVSGNESGGIPDAWLWTMAKS